MTPTSFYIVRPCVVAPVWLLRNDQIAALGPIPPDKAAIFTATGPASLDLAGPDLIPQEGEGVLRDLPGSSDDDDAYVAAIAPQFVDPDPVVADTGRPLIFYQLDAPKVLRLVKDGAGSLRVSF